MQGNHIFVSLLRSRSQTGIDALFLRYLFKFSCPALPLGWKHSKKSLVNMANGRPRHRRRNSDALNHDLIYKLLLSPMLLIDKVQESNSKFFQAIHNQPGRHQINRDPATGQITGYTEPWRSESRLRGEASWGSTNQSKRATLQLSQTGSNFTPPIHPNNRARAVQQPKKK